MILLLEASPVKEITSSEADTEGLAGIGWADTSLGSTDGSFAFLLLKKAISLNLNITDEMSTVRN